MACGRRMHANDRNDIRFRRRSSRTNFMSIKSPGSKEASEESPQFALIRIPMMSKGSTEMKLTDRDSSTCRRERPVKAFLKAARCGALDRKPPTKVSSRNLAVRFDQATETTDAI